MERSIISINHRSSRNIGDQHTDPTDYFPFHGRITHLLSREVTGEETCDLLIVGGGAMLGSKKRRLLKRVERIRARQKVVWGAGAAQKGMDKEALFAEWAGVVDVFCPREMVDGFFCVPCTSCMNPVFDQPLPVAGSVRRQLGLFANVHARPFPEAECRNEDDFATVIEYIKSCEALFTTSYHGGYWAALLGKAVLYGPFNDKFDHVPFLASYCRVEDRAAYVAQALRFPNHGVLEFARARNRALWRAVQAGGRWQSTNHIEKLYGSKSNREAVLFLIAGAADERASQSLLAGRDVWVCDDGRRNETLSEGRIAFQVFREPGSDAMPSAMAGTLTLIPTQQLVQRSDMYHAEEIRFPGSMAAATTPPRLDDESIVRVALRMGYRKVHVIGWRGPDSGRSFLKAMPDRVILHDDCKPQS